MSLDEAIEKIRESYAYAISTAGIRYPLLWALWRVWQLAVEDAKRKESRV